MTGQTCETCGDPTDMLGTKRCHHCYEVELRLDRYLARGGDKARLFLTEKMAKHADFRRRESIKVTVNGNLIDFEFNGIKLRVTPASEPKEAVELYRSRLRK